MCIGSVNAPIRAKEHILLLPGKRSDIFNMNTNLTNYFYLK